MALLDSLTNQGTIRIPNNAVRPTAEPDAPASTEPTADRGVVKLPASKNTQRAGDTIIELPNKDDYDPLSMDGVYKPNAKDILGKMIGFADARQFLKTYDFTRDPSKALYLANLAQELIWGVLPKNRIPSYVKQRDEGMNQSYWKKLKQAALKKALGALKNAVNSMTGGLLSNLDGLVRTPVPKDALSDTKLYGTGDKVHERSTKKASWMTAYDAWEGDGDIPSGEDSSIHLDDTPMQMFGQGTKDKEWTGDTHTEEYHKKVDVFKEGYGNTFTISNGGWYDKPEYTNDSINGDEGLEAEFNQDQNERIKSYTELLSPYGVQTQATSPSDAVKWAIESLGCAIGYRSWYGFEPGSNHMWDIQIYPYNGPEEEPDPTSPIPEDPDPNYTVTPKLPSYNLPNLEGSPDDEGHYFSFGKYCPALSYTLQIGSQRSKELPLYNGDSIHMPMGFNYEMIMSLNVLDDVYGSFYNWMGMYMNKLYNINEGKVVRYDQGAVIIRLIVFKNGYSPKYEFRFIAVPYNYSPQLEGDYAPNETQVHVDFHIIGMKNGYANNTVINPEAEIRQKDNVLAQTSWTDVILSPRKLE